MTARELAFEEAEVSDKPPDFLNAEELTDPGQPEENSSEKMKVWGLLCLSSLALLRTGGADERPLVDTKYGKLRGVTESVKETLKTADAFYGIPFAKPPVGSLRFANPESIEPWNSVRDASQYPPLCLQDAGFLEGLRNYYKTTFKMPPVSEDCLYLNIFTPSDRETNSKLPVMFFIHGGGLVIGGASLYDGSVLSVSEDVVVVSIQYRLGVLGFFSTGDGELRGNLGFMDQVAALHWVQENIASFGGDPNSVTIFGESAGGISVSALVLSPLAKGLFHKAIAESGTTTMPGLVVSTPEELIFYRDLVSGLFGCDVSSVAECLMLKSEEEILSVAVKMGFLVLPACVDGVFLPKPAEEILTNKESNPVPFLLGVCDHEFGWLLPLILNLTAIRDGMSRESVRQSLNRLPEPGLSPKVLPSVLDEYLSGVSDPFVFRDRLLDICGDLMFVIPALRIAKYHRDSGLPVYFYEFQHRPSLFHDVKPDFVKADHADEIVSVFGGPFLRDGIVLAGDSSDEEKELSRTVMRYWANFARNGDPNGPGLVEWPLYDAKEKYLEINLKQKTSARLKEDKFKFWSKVLSEMTLEKRGERTEL
ncbi:PREDICTED: fatty acyl-CoA hydrolase precursor, medium chain-like [Nanorana parkeri]|uniref:fatty acyl-CoA hydrolase precursor, medium chain-like n=1 Tax=Nanorana parkeri TaxID=125878 RepID=UPI000854E0FE|nr:PREDICTED: fatty acyl-CoA hydrolase precursor, medium chain-like [Nanorana parkeri]